MDEVDRPVLAGHVSSIIRSAPLRLLLVTPRYVPFVGGVENHVYQVARRFVQAGVDVGILTTDPTGQLPVEERLEGVPIRRVRAWPADRDYFFAPDVYRIIRRGGWDLVHVQSYHTLVAPLAMSAARRAGMPYIVTFHRGGHSSWLRRKLRGPQLRLLRPLLRHAARLVATARFENDLFRRGLHLADQQIVYIPNGSDLPEVPQLGSAAVDGSLIAAIGRLERYKGHQRLIAALPKILVQRPDVRLWIAGTGPYEPELWRLAHQLGVADRVDIHAIPASDREQMAIEVSKAALVVLLSDYETHPMAVLEAIALKRSVLVTDTSGLHELAEQGLVRAIPLHSTTDQIASAVLEQLYHPLNLSDMHIPTWDECAAQLLALYQDVLQRR